MENFGSFYQFSVHFFFPKHHVSTGIAIKGEFSLSICCCMYKGKRCRNTGILNQSVGQYSFTPDRIFQEIPKHIFPDFADKCNVFIQFS